MSEHERPKQINTLVRMDEYDHVQLVAAVLEFYKADFSHPDAKRIRELVDHPDFQGCTRRVLVQLTQALVIAGVLYKLPHRRTRDSAYLTHPRGLVLLEAYQRELAKGRPKPRGPWQPPE